MADEQTQKVVYDVSSAVQSAKKLTDAFNAQAKSMQSIQRAAAALGKGDAKKGIDSLINSIKGLDTLRTKSNDTAIQSEKSLTKVTEIEARKRKELEIELLKATTKAKQSELDAQLARAEANLNTELDLKRQAAKRETDLEKERIRGLNKLREIELRDRLRVEDQARNDALETIRTEAREKRKLADQQARDARRAADQARIDAERIERQRKQDFANTLRGLNNEARALNSTVGEADRQFGLFNKTLGVFAGTLKTIISFGAVGGLVAQLTEALPKAAELSNKFAEIQTISQDLNAQGEFKGVRRGLEALAKDVRGVSDAFNLQQLDVAAAQYEAVSNQITGAADSVSFLKDAAVFAKVSASSLIDSVNLLSSALNSFQLPSSRAEKVAAGFFRAIDLGRFTAQELANDLGRAAVLANSLGIRLEELESAYSTITIQGVKLANAQTLVTNVMLKLINPTEEMTAIFKEWGVSSARAAIEVYGLGGVIQRLQVEASKGNGSLAELADQFSTIRAIVGANILGQNLDKYNSNLRKIIKADEAYVVAFGLRTEQAGEIFQKELNKIQNFFTSDIGNFFVKTLSSWSKSTEGLADAFISSTRYITVFGGSLLAVNKAGQVTTSVFERLQLQQSRLSNALQIQSTIQAEINRQMAMTGTVTPALTAQMTAATASVTRFTAAAGILRATLATIAPAVAIGLVTGAIGLLVNRVISLGQIQKNVFEQITENAKTSAEATSKATVKAYQETADQVNALYKTFSRIAIRNTATQISEANSQVTSLIRLADTYKDVLLRGFTVAEGDLNTQVSLYKLLNNTISDSIRVVKDFGEVSSDSLKEAVKEFDALQKAADGTTASLRDWNKELLLSREAPATLNNTVDSEVFSDLVGNIDNIEDANEKLSTLADISSQKFGEGLALFDVGQITLGNKAINEAVTLLQKVKEESKKLREENPNGLLNVPTQEELTNILALYNQEVNNRIIQTEGFKIQNLIGESERINVEAKKAFEARDIERAEKLFSESQEFLREASRLSEAANQVVPGAFPEVTDFLGELERRSSAFSQAIDSQVAEQLENQVASAFNQVDLYRNQLDGVFDKLNETVEQATARGLAPESVDAIKARSEQIVEEILQVQDYLDLVTDSINEQGNVKGIQEVLEAAANEYEFFLESIKAENESINVEASDLLQTQQQQLDLVSKIVEGLKTQALLGKDNNKENREKLRLLEEERKANLKALQRLGPEIPKQAFDQLEDFKKQIADEQKQAMQDFETAMVTLRAGTKEDPSIASGVEAAFNAQVANPSLENLDNLNKLLDQVPDQFKAIFDDVIPALSIAQEELSTFTNLSGGIDQLFSELEGGASPLEVFTTLIERSNDELDIAYQLQKRQNAQIQASEKFTKSLNVGEEAVTLANQRRESIDGALANAIATVEGSMREELSTLFNDVSSAELEAFINGEGNGLIGRLKAILLAGPSLDPSNYDAITQQRSQLLALREAQNIFGNIGNLSGADRDQAIEKLTQTLASFEDSILRDSVSELGSLDQNDIFTKLQGVETLTPEQKERALEDAFGDLKSLDTRRQGLQALANAMQQINDPATSAKIRDVLESITSLATRDDVLSPALEALQAGVRALKGVDGVEAGFLAVSDKAVAFEKANDQLLQNYVDTLRKNDPNITQPEIDEFLRQAKDSAGLVDVVGAVENASKINEALLIDITRLLQDPNAPVAIRIPAAATGGTIPHFATGGKMPVRRGQDSVMAALTPGEFVIRKSVADQIGGSNLHRINNGLLPRYAVGGKVKDESAEYRFDQLTEQLRQELIKRYFNELGGSYRPTGFSSIRRSNKEASLIGIGIDNPFPKSTGEQGIKKPPLPYTVSASDPVVGPLLDQIKFYKEKFGFFATGGTVPEGKSILVNQFASLQELVEGLKNNLRMRGGFRRKTTSSSDLLSALDSFAVKRAAGGFVPNKPNMNVRFGTDSVLSAVNPGDFVVRQSSSRRLAPFLNTLASGGRVEETQAFGIGNGLNMLKGTRYNNTGSLTVTLSELLRRLRKYATGGKVYDLLQEELKDTLDIFVVPDPPAIKEIPKAISPGFSFTSGIRASSNAMGMQFFDNANSVGPRVQSPSTWAIPPSIYGGYGQNKQQAAQLPAGSPEEEFLRLYNEDAGGLVAKAKSYFNSLFPQQEQLKRGDAGYYDQFKPNRGEGYYDQFKPNRGEGYYDQFKPNRGEGYYDQFALDRSRQAGTFESSGFPRMRYNGGKLERFENGKWIQYDPYLATGGMVRSSFIPPKGTDTVPTMLTPGEYVVNKDVTKKWLPFLEWLNANGLSKGLDSKVPSLTGMGVKLPDGFKPHVSVDYVPGYQPKSELTLPKRPDDIEKFMNVSRYSSDNLLLNGEAYIPGVKRSVTSMNTQANTTQAGTINNAIQLVATGDEKIDAKRLIYHINREQRIGTTQVRGTQQRRVVY